MEAQTIDKVVEYLIKENTDLKSQISNLQQYIDKIDTYCNEIEKDNKELRELLGIESSK